MMIEPLKNVSKVQTPHQGDFANVSSKSPRAVRPKSAMKPATTSLLNDNNTENRSAFDLLREMPLAGLTVYVEIFSNDTNISETCYGYLENLGAKVEKRMNKKCNLVIWKDGLLKTIEKAKEYNATVVNSLWLEDCIENEHRASFEKFRPNLPNEKDMPFISIQNYKKKRKTIEPSALEPFDPAIQEEEGKQNNLKNSIQRKRRKTNFEKDVKSEGKIDVKLGSQKKLGDFFERKEIKPMMLSQISEDLNESLNNPSYQPSHRKNLIQSGDLKFKCRTDPHYSENFDEEEKEETPQKQNSKLDLRKFDKHNTNENDVYNFKKFTDNLLQDVVIRKEDTPPTGKVKNMILSYACTNPMTGISKEEMEHQENSPMISEENLSCNKSEDLMIKKRRLSTGSTTKDHDISCERSTTNSSQLVKEQISKKEKKNKDVSCLEKIVQKCFQPKNKENERRSVKKEKNSRSNNSMAIEDEEEQEKEKASKRIKVQIVQKVPKALQVIDMNIEKVADKGNEHESEESIKKEKIFTPGKPSSRKGRGRSEVKADSRISDLVPQEVDVKSTKGVNRPASVAKNFIIAKYLEYNEESKENRASMLIENNNASNDTERRDKKEIQTSPVLTRSQKKAKQRQNLDDDLFYGIFDDRKRENSSRKTPADKQDSLYATRETENLNKKESKKEKPPPAVNRSLFDCGFSKKTEKRAQSVGKRSFSKGRGKNSTIKPVDDEITDEEDEKSSKKKTIKAKDGIIFNNIPSLDASRAKEFCREFNFRYLDDELSNVSNIQMIVFNGPQIPKNYRIALAMLGNNPIIKKEWVEDSLKEGSIQDCEDYKVKYQYELRMNLFAKMRFSIDPEFEQVPKNAMNKNHLVTLIEGAGGAVNEVVRACDFYITKRSSKKKLNIPPHVKVITPQWIIDSIVEGKFMNAQHVNYTVL